MFCVPPVCQNYVMTRTPSVRRVVERYVLMFLFVLNAKAGRRNFVSCI